MDIIVHIVMVDGKKMTGEQVNEKFGRSMLKYVGAIVKENAFKKYSVNEDVMETITQLPHVNPDVKSLFGLETISIHFRLVCDRDFFKAA
jgi:hypothetical protein